MPILQAARSIEGSFKLNWGVGFETMLYLGTDSQDHAVVSVDERWSNCPMETLPPSAAGDSVGWYLVCLGSGATAVVPAEDLAGLFESGSVLSAVMVSSEMGRKFEEARARTGYMSATCRIKAGESDGVS